jgi:hypothetical protein
MSVNPELGIGEVLVHQLESRINLAGLSFYDSLLRS